MSSAAERRPSIVYGPRAPIPLTLTFGQLLDHHAEERPDSPAVISHVQNCKVSFRQLRDRSINLAKAMAEAGIGKGSLVGIISGTRYEYLEVIPQRLVKTSDTNRELADILRLCQVRSCFDSLQLCLHRLRNAGSAQGYQ